jgi:hypothetical protein
MKICPVVAELFHAYGQPDRQTDMTKLIVAFRIFRTLLRMFETRLLADWNSGEHCHACCSAKRSE